MGYVNNILKNLLKRDLVDIGSLFGVQVPPPGRKTELVTSLSGYIEGHPDRWLDSLPERDLRLLYRLVSLPSGQRLELELPPYSSVLEGIGFVHYSSDYDSYRNQVWIDEEFRRMVAPHVVDAIRRGEESGRFELETLLMGMANFYGIIGLKEFVYKCADILVEAGRDIEPIKDVMMRSPFFFIFREGEEIVSPCVTDRERIREDRRKYLGKRRRMAMLTYAQAMDYGGGAPFCVLCEDTPQCGAVKDALREIGYTEEEIRCELHDIWYYSQYVDEEEGADAIFKSVADCRDEISSFGEFEDYLHRIADYANILPKWKLRGHLAEEDSPLWVGLSARKRLASGVAMLELSIPYVAADAPCPCGSGLSYRRCHGKYLN